MSQTTLLKALGYTFQNEKLLQQALTHRSFGEEHNERLEFLGDAMVNFVIAEVLYTDRPKANEGELSRWRASLINRETLALLAKQMNLSVHLKMGPGEKRIQGHERASTLSCAMESVIGAIYMDGGFQAVRDCILRWYEPLLQNLPQTVSIKDPKTMLQEYLQAQHLPLPIYEVKSITGRSHQQLFSVTCKISSVKEVVIGKGSSRRRAEQDAAQIMLGKIKK